MTLKHTTNRIRLKRAELYKGIYSRVARQLGVDRSSVCRVAAGGMTSRRIEKALIDEARRIERRLEQHERNLKNSAA